MRVSAVFFCFDIYIPANWKGLRANELESRVESQGHVDSHVNSVAVRRCYVVWP